jgi:hypothetical protein
VTHDFDFQLLSFERDKIGNELRKLGVLLSLQSSFPISFHTCHLQAVTATAQPVMT